MKARTIKVREVMSRTPVTVTPDTPIDELNELFTRFEYAALPVVDTGGVLEGIVTRLDILRLFQARFRGTTPGSPWRATVLDIMRRGVITVERDDPLDVVVDLMLETRFHSLPVVEWRRGHGPYVVGMVSRTDLLQAMAHQEEVVQVNDTAAP